MGSLYTQPISLFLGTDYTSVPFPYFQADGLTPKSLAGLAARLMLRVNPGDQIPQVKITDAFSTFGQVLLGQNPNGGILQPMNGLVAFSLTQLGLQQIQDRSGIWALYLDAPGTPLTSVFLASGTWSLCRTAIQ